jgi:GcrA cell cycle regulator
MMARWTAEKDATLRALWAAREGGQTLSIAEIGRRMRITKNAVVGRAHRLMLPARPSPIRPRSEDRPIPQRAAHRVAVATALGLAPAGERRSVPVPAPAPAAVAPAPLSVEFVTARLMARIGGPKPVRGCRYPMWPDAARPPQPPLYCSEAVQPGSSYCPAHHALCRVSPRDWARINSIGPTRGWGSVPR